MYVFNPRQFQVVPIEVLKKRTPYHQNCYVPHTPGLHYHWVLLYRYDAVSINIIKDSFQIYKPPTVNLSVLPQYIICVYMVGSGSDVTAAFYLTSAPPHLLTINVKFVYSLHMSKSYLILLHAGKTERRSRRVDLEGDRQL